MGGSSRRAASDAAIRARRMSAGLTRFASPAVMRFNMQRSSVRGDVALSDKLSPGCGFTADAVGKRVRRFDPYAEPLSFELLLQLRRFEEISGNRKNGVEDRLGSRARRQQAIPGCYVDVRDAGFSQCRNFRQQRAALGRGERERKHAALLHDRKSNRKIADQDVDMSAQEVRDGGA